MATPMARTATPPTTPPTIAPIFGELRVGGGLEDGAGDEDGEALGDDEEASVSFLSRIALIKALSAVVWFVGEKLALGGPTQEDPYIFVLPEVARSMTALN